MSEAATEPLALTDSDFAWLKERAPADIVEEMIAAGEFVRKTEVDVNEFVTRSNRN